MHDTHQGSKVSEIIMKSFFTPPPLQFYTEKSDSYLTNQRRLFFC